MKVPLNGTLWEILYNSNLQWSHNIKELLNSDKNDEIVFEKAYIYEKLESNPENESCFLRCQNKIDLKKINTIKYYKNDNYFVKNLAILDLRDNII